MLLAPRAGLLLLSLAPLLPAAIVIQEDFSDVPGLTSRGWQIRNNSNPAGSTSWFAGNPGIFPPFNGPASAYLAANFLNTDPLGGAISTWLMTPVVTLRNGDTVDFYTRGEADSPFADRLEVRFSTSAGSTDVGATPDSLGVFTRLGLTLNAGLSPGAYPEDWTSYTAAVSGLSGPAFGRFAFRYSIPDTASAGNYIGLDQITIDASPVPEPGSLLLLGGGAVILIGLAALRRRAAAGSLCAAALLLLQSQASAEPPAPVRARSAQAKASVSPAPRGRVLTGKSSRRLRDLGLQQGPGPGMIAFVDPKTGQLRTPEPGEMHSLSVGPGASVRRTGASPDLTTLPNGTVQLRLSAEQMSATHAQIGPDGKISYRCSHGLTGHDHAQPQTSQAGGRNAEK